MPSHRQRPDLAGGLGDLDILLLNHVVWRTPDFNREAHAAMPIPASSHKITGRHIVDLLDIMCRGDELAWISDDL